MTISCNSRTSIQAHQQLPPPRLSIFRPTTFFQSSATSIKQALPYETFPPPPPPNPDHLLPASVLPPLRTQCRSNLLAAGGTPRVFGVVNPRLVGEPFIEVGWILASNLVPPRPDDRWVRLPRRRWGLPVADEELGSLRFCTCERLLEEICISKRSTVVGRRRIRNDSSLFFSLRAGGRRSLFYRRRRRSLDESRRRVGSPFLSFGRTSWRLRVSWRDGRVEGRGAGVGVRVVPGE